jgi:hypothetical protein
MTPGILFSCQARFYWLSARIGWQIIEVTMLIYKVPMFISLHQPEAEMCTAEA